MSGQKILDGLKEAIAGDFGRVTIDGQVWVRFDNNPLYRAAPEMLAALRQLAADHPAFRSKPIGGEGSQARAAQQRAIAAEDAARAAIAKATGGA